MPSSREDSSSAWLPEFCAAPTALSLLILSGAVLLMIQLAPSGAANSGLDRVPLGMLFVFAMTALGIASLCALRKALSDHNTVVIVASTFVVVLAWAAAGSWLAFWFDRTLGLGITGESQTTATFMLGNAAVAAIAWGIALRYFYIRGQWQSQVRANAQARLDALQARIRPHFLFNSLNTIASLVRSQPADAERAVEDLSELLRMTLRGDGESTLGAELALIDHYLEIERLRLGQRLTIDRDLLDAPLELPMPSLLLQPLVENAILHGIQQLESGGRISLSVHRTHDSVEIVVTNPVPAQPGRLHRGSGTALANIRQRLRHRFGDQARLEQEEGAGYHQARLVIPLL